MKDSSIYSVTVPQEVMGTVMGMLCSHGAILQSTEIVAEGNLIIRVTIGTEDRQRFENWFNTYDLEAEVRSIQTGRGCCFCGKMEGEVRKLVGNPGGKIFICNECISRCTTILQEKRI